jgi:hypothetical protein
VLLAPGFKRLRIMKKAILFLGIALSIIIFGCNSPIKSNGKQSITTEETLSVVENPAVYETVESLLEKAEGLSGKTVNVSGVIDHVCKHGGKRFKILSSDGAIELKIELGEKFNEVHASVVGNTAKVTGVLTPIKYDAKMVKAWEEKMKDGHKGEENTKHYKEELSEIQEIHRRIVDGEIPFYTMFSVQADKYELE